MNRDSDNFTAEMVLKQLGTLDGGHGSTAAGARLVMASMARGRHPDGRASGSSTAPASRPSTASRRGRSADVIRGGHLGRPGSGRRSSPRSPSTGKTGTLADCGCRTSPGSSAARPGTTNIACTLAGLIRGDVVFAVLQNGSPVAFWPARVAQDRFVTALAKGPPRAATSP